MGRWFSGLALSVSDPAFPERVCFAPAGSPSKCAKAGRSKQPPGLREESAWTARNRAAPPRPKICQPEQREAGSVPQWRWPPIGDQPYILQLRESLTRSEGNMTSHTFNCGTIPPGIRNWNLQFARDRAL